PPSPRCCRRCTAGWSGCSVSFFFQAEDGIRDRNVTGVQTCALPILPTTDAAIEKIPATGSCSSTTNSAVSSDAVASSFPGSDSRVRNPVLPNTVSHTMDAPTGANNAPTMNERIVRPYEMRARNIPTNGDQDIHQPQ